MLKKAIAITLLITTVFTHPVIFKNGKVFWVSQNPNFSDIRLGVSKKNNWFSDEFIEIGSIEYHVRGQKKFWLDIMGGGEYYNGGEKKLNFHHKLVKNIMTSKGANIWMYHMNNALNKMDFSNDKRIRKCIDVFLKYFMTKYAIEFDFNFFSIMKTKL